MRQLLPRRSRNQGDLLTDQRILHALEGIGTTALVLLVILVVAAYVLAQAHSVWMAHR